jgi:hypothetical protein
MLPGDIAFTTFVLILVIVVIVLIAGLAGDIGGWPGRIARRKNSSNAETIRQMGLVGLIVWPCFIAALVWAIRLEPILPRVDRSLRACPFCAETIKAAAVLCRFCGRHLA